jgi:hypothetical protein
MREPASRDSGQEAQEEKEGAGTEGHCRDRRESERYGGCSASLFNIILSLQCLCEVFVQQHSLCSQSLEADVHFPHMLLNATFPSGMYAVPISFVSGGVQASLELVRQSESTADVPCERASSQHSDSSSSDSEHEPVRRGLGVTASAMPNSLVQENEDASNGARSSGSSESDSEPASMGLGASKPSYSSGMIESTLHVNL